MTHHTPDQQIRQDAADWIVRLHAEYVSEQDKAAFCSWLEEDPRHATLFERVSDSWDLIAGVAKPVPHYSAPALVKTHHTPNTTKLRRRALLPLLVAGVGGLILSYPRNSVASRVLKTGTGQTLTHTQSNGVEWRLDTDTILLLNEQTMTSRLLRGQICLNCPEATPIKLMVGNLEATIQKAGRFDASLTDTTCELLAISGQFSIQNTGTLPAARVITQGERVALAQNNTLVTDKPNMRDRASWTQGYLVFHDRSVLDISKNINRYSNKKIKILSKDIETKKMNGVYYISQNKEFLEMLSTLLKIQVHETENEYLLYAV
ncbi:FecR protein [Acetobacter cibinongensis]|uniref:FecR protein n=1 Tax=Acetobacter cibinongensis TaxID=146475 RepID=A0A0D6N0Y7_9PROT|nr:DUF4880 domain-containing protein [Acetobacter cibinongensis]GAN59599.1 iron transport regulator protein/sensor kinase [Acetobacter cibinongensis]GBQ15459.1 FecR protein [Acetobacter cibinongensis NRIC 0482]GEL59122.1 FecR protein [Acetobacter cibinongensis]